jgi:hypothetical protein
MCTAFFRERSRTDGTRDVEEGERASLLVMLIATLATLASSVALLTRSGGASGGKILR